ncbi:MAG: hypothetical protein V1784_00845, partial [bacterium]
MRTRLSIGLGILMAVLVSLGVWLGCQQKGDLAPTSTGQGELLYFDSVRVSRSSLAPSQSLEIEAHVLSESGRNGAGVAVRFSADDGHFAGTDADTTANTDAQGWARATFVAPEDTGITPHYLLGGVMLEGINGIDFGYTLLSSPHATLANCIDCHMGPVP